MHLILGGRGVTWNHATVTNRCQHWLVSSLVYGMQLDRTDNGRLGADVCWRWLVNICLDATPLLLAHPYCIAYSASAAACFQP